MRLILSLVMAQICCCVFAQHQSLSLSSNKFNISYSDTAFLSRTSAQLKRGVGQVEDFFGQSFRKKFDVKIFSDRKSLDEFWQKDWNAPDFKSQCWMVASGDSKGITMLSLAAWTTEACEHKAADAVATQKLITHELVHVFHYQVGNESNEDLESIGWFVEGLATYASGQLDDKRIGQTKEMIRQGKNPTELENFWSGQARYGQSGTLVQWIDKTYGRQTLIELLTLSTEKQILEKLKLSESELIQRWKESMM